MIRFYRLTINDLINYSQSNLEVLKTQYYTELVDCLVKKIEKKSNVSNNHSNQLHKESTLINQNYNDNNFHKFPNNDQESSAPEFEQFNI